VSMTNELPKDAKCNTHQNHLPKETTQPADILETFRDYLLMVANRGMNQELRVKVAPSDVVQEAITAAVHDFDTFRGSTERELISWLTQILAYRIANEARRYRRQKNNIQREISLEEEAHLIALSLTDHQKTPSAHIIAHEEEARLMDALSKLDSISQKLVRMRNWDELSFQEIGQILGYSESGARKRWAHAIKELKQILKS